MTIYVDTTGQTPSRGELLGAALAQTRDLVLPAMRAAFDDLDPELRLVCAYHEGWVDIDGRPVDGAAGKLLRPTLALAAAEAVGGDPASAVASGAAVEMVHAFSLLHDDIMDNDTERRHRTAAWKAFGVPMAILAGDALLSLSQLLAAPRVRAARRLARDTQRLITGERLDLAFETRRNVTLADYVTMATGKTGALISAACALGAEAVDAPDSTVEALAWCGERLGLAFQIVDDILGIWGDPTATGKPVFADLRRRKKSYPVVVALCGDGTDSARLREIYLGSGELPADLVAEAAYLVEAAGGRTTAHQAVSGCLSEITQVIDDLGIPRDTLLAIADAMTDRVR